MATEQKTKDEGWSRAKHLFHSVYFLDYLIIMGFLLSIAVMSLTICFISAGEFVERNPVTAMFFSGERMHLIWVFGIFWGIVFTVYYKFRDSMVGAFLAFYTFSMYSFNFIHDIVWVVVS